LVSVKWGVFNPEPLLEWSFCTSGIGTDSDVIAMRPADVSLIRSIYLSASFTFFGVAERPLIPSQKTLSLLQASMSSRNWTVS
jgi:hypothetical protein